MDDTTQDIGGLLRRRREQLGYSLREAAEQTRIRQVLLESIEENRFSDLPGQAYVTGFIRVYAGFLGLDSDSLLVQLEEDLPIGTGTSAVKHIPVAKHKPGRLRKTSTRQGSSSLLWGLLAILLIGAAVYYLPGYFQEKPPAALSTEPATPAGEAAPPPAEPVASTLQEEAVPRVEAAARAENSTQVDSSAGSATGQPVLEEPARTEVSSGPEPAGQAAPPTEAPSREETPAPTPEPNRYPPIAPAGSSLRMLAVGESSLVIYLEGRTPHHYKLRDGLDLTWKIKRRVKVEMAEPGVARFWLDGAEIDLGNQPVFQLQAGPGG